MSGKKFFNDPTLFVDDAVRGLVAANPGLAFLPSHRVVYREDIDSVKSSQVTLVSGGGAGHEPSHAGFVGDGMLSAAVCGAVFSSPSSSQVLAAITRVASPKGVLVIVKNYTGDRLQFGKAVERARLLLPEVPIKLVVVQDDASHPPKDVKKAGRRGLAGVVLIHKVAGEMARRGHSLDEIYNVVSKIANEPSSLATVGVGLTPCTLPGQPPSFTLKEDEMEFGLGIHGESGTHRLKVATSKDTVKLMGERLLDTVGSCTGKTHILLVNNLGGTTNLELNIVLRDALEFLKAKGVTVVRVIQGTLMTSLEMAGVSLTLMENVSVGKDVAAVDLIDTDANSAGWPRVVVPAGSSLAKFHGEGVHDFKTRSNEDSVVSSSAGASASSGKPAENKWTATLVKMCTTLATAEPELTAMDRICGDGDCGYSVKAGADAVCETISSMTKDGSLTKVSEASLLTTMSEHVEARMGGSSGAFVSILLDSAAHVLADYRAKTPAGDVPVSVWAQALRKGTDAVMYYGGATLGDRTFLDALLPAVDILTGDKTSSGDIVKDASSAAEKGAAHTAELDTAGAGRSSYLADGAVTGTRDPGAHAVALAFAAISK